MKHLTLFRYFLILVSLAPLFLKGQTKEIGVVVGYSNLISDIGNNNPISPFENGRLAYDPMVGVFYKKVLNPRLLVKLSASYAQVRAQDLNSSRKDRLARGEFKKDLWEQGELAKEPDSPSNLFEVATTLEYNFYDIYNGVYKSTPYIFAGVGGFLHQNSEVKLTVNLDDGLPPTSPTDYEVNAPTKKKYRPQIAIPFGLGYKFRIQEKFMLGVEFGVRATLYDNLDYSNPKKFEKDIDQDLINDPTFGEDIKQNINSRENVYKTGNTSNFDWYTFTGISFSYLFGEPPCYCK